MPVVRGGLSKEAKARIPRRIGAGEKPPPIRGVWGEHPDGATESPGEVDARGVDADKEVKARENLRGRCPIFD